MSKVTDEYKTMWAQRISENAQKLMDHYNYRSVLQLGNVIGAPDSAISRWVKLTGEVGVQPAYFFGLVFEALGMSAIEVLFTGHTNTSDLEKMIKRMNLEQSLQATRLIADHIENLAKGNIA